MNTFLKIYFAITIYTVYGKFFFSIPVAITDLLVIGFIFLSTYTDKFNLHIPYREGKYFFSAVIIPAAVMLVYSLGIQLISSFSSDYLVHSITLCVRLALYGLFAMRSAHIFGEKTANLLLTSCIIVYIPSIVTFFIQYGLITGILTLFSSNIHDESVALEVHRLTYIFGFIAVYFFYQKIINEKKVLPQAITALCFMLLGVKRITYLALAAAIGFIFIIKFQKEKTKHKILIISSVSMICFALLYVLLIRNGQLQVLFAELGINDSFRFNFWNYFANKYDVSPMFFGYGLSYSHRFMWHEWSNIKDLSEVTNLHNDVLGYYLGLGFAGFILFFSMFFHGQAKLIKKYFSTNTACFVFVISLFYFILMMVCNEGLPGFIYGLYLTMIFSAISADKSQSLQTEGISI